MRIEFVMLTFPMYVSFSLHQRRWAERPPSVHFQFYSEFGIFENRKNKKKKRREKSFFYIYLFFRFIIPQVLVGGGKMGWWRLGRRGSTWAGTHSQARQNGGNNCSVCGWWAGSGRDWGIHTACFCTDHVVYFVNYIFLGWHNHMAKV